MTTQGPVLAGTEPLGDIQAAVMGVLRDDPRLDGIGLYDYVPENAEPPWVTFDTAWLAERDTLTGCADRVWFQISVFSKYRGYAEAGMIGNEVVEALHHLILLIPAYLPIHILREQTHYTRDPDNRLRRVAFTFNCPYVSLAPPGGP